MFYRSINQFRNTVKYVNQVSKITGTTPPRIAFDITTKIHGTNGGIKIHGDGTVEAMSRKNLLVDGADNHGFAKFVETNKNHFQRYTPLDKSDTTYIFGEWCGKGIQSGVAVSEVEKTFVMFESVIEDVDGNIKPRPLREVYNELNAAPMHRPYMEELNNDRIYFIWQFHNELITIDFADTLDVGNKLNYMVDLVAKIEAECPVGKYFGIESTGEGIVVKPVSTPANFRFGDLCFKVKGKKHSNSKVKTTASVDVEALASLHEFLDYAVTPNRVAQAVFELGVDVDSPSAQSRTGDVIKWVIVDVIKEESDTMEESGIDRKILGKNAPAVVRNHFFNLLGWDS